MSDHDDIPAIQRESALAMAHIPFIAIVERGGRYDVVQHKGPGGVAPTSSYDTKREAASRVLQLLHCGPVAPQHWPEVASIGSVDLEPPEEAS